MMDCAVILITDILLASVRGYFGVSEDKSDELVRMFISKLPETWNKRFTVTQAV